MTIINAITIRSFGSPLYAESKDCIVWRTNTHAATVKVTIAQEELDHPRRPETPKMTHKPPHTNPVSKVKVGKSPCKYRASELKPAKNKPHSTRSIATSELMGTRSAGRLRLSPIAELVMTTSLYEFNGIGFMQVFLLFVL